MLVRGVVQGGGGGLSGVANAEAVILVNAMGAAGAYPVSDRINLIDGLIGSLKSTGVWAKLSHLWVTAAHAEAAALFDWVNPTGTKLTPVSAPAFTVDVGYVGDGVADYLDTGINENALAQDDHCAGVFVSSTAVSNVVLGSPKLTVVSRGSSNAYTTRSATTNTNNTSEGAVTSALGMTSVSRSGSSAYDVRRNGVTAGSPSRTSEAWTGGSIYLLARNDGASAAAFSGSTLNAAFLGSALSADQSAALYAALLTYLTALEVPGL